MNIQEALDKMSINAKGLLKTSVEKAREGDDNLIEFVDMMLDQYFDGEQSDPKSNKNKLDKIFGEDVIKCLIEYANKVNALADIRLMEIQELEAHGK